MVQVPAPNVPLLWAPAAHRRAATELDPECLGRPQAVRRHALLRGPRGPFSGHRFAWSDETETCLALDDRELRVFVGALARDLLGLTGDEAVDLFFAEDRAGIGRVVAAVERRAAQLLLRESEDIGAVLLIVAEPTWEQVSSLFAMV